MVIFGGWSYEFGQPMGDVWSLSLTGSHAWSSLDDALPAGNIPGGRVGHSAIYDPVRQRMLIFGGSDVDGRLVNDVWVLSLAGAPVWSQLTPDGEPPSARFAHRAIYDPAGDRMIVFGGLDSAAMRSDVWALSLSGSPVWTQLLPQGPGPAARAAYGMVYDPLGKRVIVHGGTDNHQLYDDTWALSLNGQPVWSQISALAPPSVLRFYHTAVYDPQGQRMVIWGGSHHGVDLSDTWALALTGPPVWTEVPPTNETPEPRSGHSAVYVPSDGRMIVFGGSFDLNDAWALPLAGPRGRASWDGELAQVQGSSSLALGEPRPNPSRGESVVDFTLPYASRVTLAVYDAAGRRVRQIANGEFSSGAHGLRWDGRDANGHPSPTGLYFLTLEASGGSITRKAVIAR
jgi:hypothetical protein